AGKKPREQALDIERAVLTQAQRDARAFKITDRQTIFESRTETGRQVRALQARVESVKFHADAPSEEVGRESIAAEQAEYEAKRKEVDVVLKRLSAAQFELQGKESAVSRASGNVNRAELALEEARKAVTRAEASLADAVAVEATAIATKSDAMKVVEAAQAEVDALPELAPVDFAGRFAEVQAVNDKVRTNKERERLKAELAQY